MIVLRKDECNKCSRYITMGYVVLCRYCGIKFYYYLCSDCLKKYSILDTCDICHRDKKIDTFIDGDSNT